MKTTLRAAPKSKEPCGTPMFELTSERTTPTVFVVDGDPLAASTVEGVSRMMGLACQRYASGKEFLAAYDPDRPGCAVLEVQIPDVNGLEIQRRLAAQGESHPVVFVSAHPRLSIAVQAMRSGAVHFLQKPAREHELWSALDEAIQLDRRRRKQRRREQRFHECVDRMTARDWQLLQGLIDGSSNREVATRLKISKRAVEQRRANLLKKFNVGSLAELVRTCITANGAMPRIFSERMDALIGSAR